MAETRRSVGRREFLRGGATLAAGAVMVRGTRGLVGQSAPASPSSGLGTTKLSQFSYADVRLLDGPLLKQFQHNHWLFMHLDEDSLLKPFRQLSGLPAPGEDMGGWYSPSTKFNPPKDMTGYVPGHTFGQYVSGLARAYAATGDSRTQQKVQRLVSGYAATMTTKFYDGYCLPAYTFDKINCGLIDAHQFAKDPKALAVLDKATDAVLPWLPQKALNRAEMKVQPHPTVAYEWDESYTLPENFYLAYHRGAGTRYRQLARRFLQDDTYFNALAENKNVLPGEHAYSHVNALCSAMQSYLVDGSQKHLRAARNGFQFVLDQSFATGGWGPNESFCHPGTEELAQTLTTSHNAFETPCGAYGHFKIARYLMRATGESTYGDSMEAVLYNTILGARPIRPDGTTFYYADFSHNARKVDYEQKWPCCSGTFPQLTADYGISSYLRSPRGIYVNLYVPSQVTWRQGNARISLLQETKYPVTGETSLAFEMDRAERFVVALRIPAWANDMTRVTVNGKRIDANLHPGTWAEIDRTWKDGDRVELSLGMSLRLVPLDTQHPNLVALVHGPVALFAIEPGSVRMTRQQLLAAERVGGSADWRVGNKIMMKPFPAVTNETYRLYQQI